MEIHSSWKGFIQLSLVTIPVKAVTAHESDREIKMHQLHKDCNQRINYKKTCAEHGEVRQKDIIRGFEYAKDQYVVIEDDDLAKLRAERDNAVRISGFVEEDRIGWLYFEGKNYFLIPDGAIGQKPYALLRESMAESGRLALATVVLSSRQHLVVLKPQGKLIAMAVLYHHDQVREEDKMESYVEDVALEPGEKELTRTLIQASEISGFDIRDYKDDYRESVLKLIDLKIQGKEIVEASRSDEPKIINLMDALKKSVEAAVKEHKRAG